MSEHGGYGREFDRTGDAGRWDPRHRPVLPVERRSEPFPLPELRGRSDPADDLAEIASRLGYLHDLLRRGELDVEHGEQIEHLGWLLDSLRASVFALEQRVAAAEGEALAVRASESYRVGHALVGTVMAPRRWARRLRRWAHRLRRWARRLRRGPRSWRRRFSRARMDLATGRPEAVAPRLVFLAVGLAESELQGWMRAISETAVLGGAFVPVFVVDEGSRVTASGFPVVRVEGRAEWEQRGEDGSWGEHLVRSVVGFLQAFAPAGLVGVPGAGSSSGVCEVDPLLEVLTSGEVLGAMSRTGPDHDG